MISPFRKTPEKQLQTLSIMSPSPAVQELNFSTPPHIPDLTFATFCPLLQVKNLRNGVLYKFIRFKESVERIFLVVEEKEQLYKINVSKSFPSPSG